MKVRILSLWYGLRSSLWFVPTIMVSLAIGLSFGMIALDEAVKKHVLREIGWVWIGGPEGARELLSTVAGSMMTVAGVVFSITIVALSLASSQFGPRLLRNFMRDSGNQIVLGTFIATFLYCLLVLRTIRSSDGTEFVPYLSVTLGVVLAIASLGVLIYFIHHVAVSIQAPNVIAAVSHDLDDAIDRLFPERLGQGAAELPLLQTESDVSTKFACGACPVAAAGSGYLQAIDAEKLMSIATTNDLLLRLEHRPGKFIVQGTDLVTVWPSERVDEHLAAEINEAFILGAERTYEQDAEFAVNQLVEVAVRALSPGINDPFTAMTCVDRLGAALCRLAQRKMPSAYRYAEDHTLRVIANPVTSTGIIDTAFSQIRHYGRSSVAVLVCLLDTIALVATHAQREEDRMALRRQTIAIKHGRDTELQEEDRKKIEERYDAALKALEQKVEDTTRTVVAEG